MKLHHLPSPAYVVELADGYQIELLPVEEGLYICWAGYSGFHHPEVVGSNMFEAIRKGREAVNRWLQDHADGAYL